MSIITALEKRRSIYALNKELPVSQEEVVALIEKVTSLVPDAFNMRSARAVIVLGEKHDALWDAVYEAFAGKLTRERTDSFKAAAGTVLYFYDRTVMEGKQAAFPSYSQNFPIWVNQANGMLQFSIWCALRELDIGASVQHFNPVIDDAVKKLFDIPENWTLVAQMPFGGIAGDPKVKDGEDIRVRVLVRS